MLELPESWSDPGRDPWLDAKDKEPWERWFYAIREYWLDAKVGARDETEEAELAKAAEGAGYWPPHNPQAVGERVWRRMIKSRKSFRETMQELGLSFGQELDRYEEPTGWIQTGSIKHAFAACVHFCGVLAARRAGELKTPPTTRPDSDKELAQPGGEAQFPSSRATPGELIDAYLTAHPEIGDHEALADKIGVSRDVLFAIKGETRWVRPSAYVYTAKLIGCTEQEIYPRLVNRKRRKGKSNKKSNSKPD